MALFFIPTSPSVFQFVFIEVQELLAIFPGAFPRRVMVVAPGWKNVSLGGFLINDLRLATQAAIHQPCGLQGLHVCLYAAEVRAAAQRTPTGLDWPAMQRMLDRRDPSWRD